MPIRPGPRQQGQSPSSSFSSSSKNTSQRAYPAKHRANGPGKRSCRRKGQVHLARDGPHAHLVNTPGGLNGKGTLSAPDWEVMRSVMRLYQALQFSKKPRAAAASAAPTAPAAPAAARKTGRSERGQAPDASDDGREP